MRPYTLLLFLFLVPRTVFAQGTVQIEIAEPFRVRTVQGRVLDQGKQPISGAEFQVHYSFDTFPTTITDRDGMFRLPNIFAEGRYSFRVTRSGFNPVVGTVIVSKDADKNSQIEITMEPST